MNHAAIGTAARIAVAAAVATGAPALAAAQTLSKCTLGQNVIDTEGKTGVIVSDGSNLCRVKYPDGLTYGWIYWNLRPTAAPDATLPSPAAGAPSNNTAELPTVLRPASNHTLVYRADPRGHIRLEARVNGVSVRFLIDTGASLVFLTTEDARAAGFSHNELVFNQHAQSANGPVAVAPVLLREVRIGDLTVEGVQAAVIENLESSALGMSFLRRLKSFEMQNGALTIKW